MNCRKLLFMASCAAVLTIFMALPPLVYADDNHSDDHNSLSPVQVGYAIVTPTSAATSGLVVFETFGEHQGDGGHQKFNALQAGVLPSTMTTHAALFANANGRLSRNLGVAFANPSATPANITLILRNDAGASVGFSTFVLAAHQHTSRFVTQLFENQASVPRDFLGTLDISSDIPIAVMGVRYRGVSFSTIPATILGPVAAVPVVEPNVGGPAAVVLAQFVAGGGWASEVLAANFGTDPLVVRVDLFSSDGSPLTATLNGQTASNFQNITIPAGGVVALAPRDQEGDSDF